MIELFAFKLRDTEFKLDEGFVDTYRGEQPEWGPVGYITYKRTYSRVLPDGNTEEFWQTCRRVVEGTYQIQQRHCQLVHTPWDIHKAQRSAQIMYGLMWSFKFLPPGRGLWMMGTEFVKSHGSACLQNCAFKSTQNIDHDFADPFTFLMDMSMLGVGVGGDVRGAGKIVLKAPRHADYFWTVPDTRAGWVEALRMALEAYAYGNILPRFDYSAIRSYGTPIKGFGGVAAGPDPLKQLVEVDVPSVLTPLIGHAITQTAIVDLFNFVGKCVIAGNVRRTAEIMFGGTDDEYLGLKDPDKHGEELMDRRWASNNSVFAHEGMDYSRAAALTTKNGEPGYAWLDNMRAYGRMKDPPNHKDAKVCGGNPCLEQSLFDGELCNLVETFPAQHYSLDDYLKTCKYAYLYAKTVTLVPTHNEHSNAIMARNRRIGMSQSGIIQNFDKIGRREHMVWCDTSYEHVQNLDRIYSDWLGIPMSIKTTSIKPSGTVSKLPGSTCGMHFPPSEYYIQRIRFAKGSPHLDALEVAGYPIEVDKYSPNTYVVEFPVKEAHFVKAESDVSMWEQLSIAAQLQKYWADNQVSCTVKFKNRDPHIDEQIAYYRELLDERVNGNDSLRATLERQIVRAEKDQAAYAVKVQAEIAAALELFEDQLKGISFLPEAHGYEQAPWEPIKAIEYDRRVAQLQPLVLNGNTHDQTDEFCDGGACQINLGANAT